MEKGQADRETLGRQRDREMGDRETEGRQGSRYFPNLLYYAKFHTSQKVRRAGQRSHPLAHSEVYPF